MRFQLAAVFRAPVRQHRPQMKESPPDYSRADIIVYETVA